MSLFLCVHYQRLHLVLNNTRKWLICICYSVSIQIPDTTQTNVHNYLISCDLWHLYIPHAGTQTLRMYSQHTYTQVHVGDRTSVRYGHAVYAPVVRDIPGVPNTYQQFTPTLCSLSQSVQSKTRMYVYN